MMAIKQPYNVNTASEAAGLAALRNRDRIMVSVNALRKEKDRMYSRLCDEIPWLRPVPSDANFVLSEVRSIPAVDVYEELRKRGVIIRFFGSQGALAPHHLQLSLTVYSCPSTFCDLLQLSLHRM
jgi:histidinol-phosphate aminotransferase